MSASVSNLAAEDEALEEMGRIAFLKYNVDTYPSLSPGTLEFIWDNDVDTRRRWVSVARVVYEKMKPA